LGCRRWLQRLSTIFSFIGELKNEQGDLEKPLTLEKTEYLPALEGLQWENAEDPNRAISRELQRQFKREKVDIKIIKAESDANAKFELFQRLNTGGTALSEQEVRNCLLIMLDREVYDWVAGLSKNDMFLEACPISQRQEDEAFAMELVIRFFVNRYFSEDETIDSSDIGEYLTKRMKSLFINKDFDLNSEKEIFESTFRIFAEALSDSSFRRFNKTKNKHEGPFLLSLYEVFSPVVSDIVEKGSINDAADYNKTLFPKIENLSKTIASNPDYIEATKPGTRSINRFSKLVVLGRSVFGS